MKGKQTVRVLEGFFIWLDFLHLLQFKIFTTSRREGPRVHCHNDISDAEKAHQMQIKLYDLFHQTSWDTPDRLDAVYPRCSCQLYPCRTNHLLPPLQDVPSQPFPNICSPSVPTHFQRPVRVSQLLLRFVSLRLFSAFFCRLFAPNPACKPLFGFPDFFAPGLMFVHTQHDFTCGRRGYICVVTHGPVARLDRTLSSSVSPYGNVFFDHRGPCDHMIGLYANSASCFEHCGEPLFSWCGEKICKSTFVLLLPSPTARQSQRQYLCMRGGKTFSSS